MRLHTLTFSRVCSQSSLSAWGGRQRHALTKLNEIRTGQPRPERFFQLDSCCPYKPASKERQIRFQIQTLEIGRNKQQNRHRAQQPGIPDSTRSLEQSRHRRDFARHRTICSSDCINGADALYFVRSCSDTTNRNCECGKYHHSSAGYNERGTLHVDRRDHRYHCRNWRLSGVPRSPHCPALLYIQEEEE